VELVKSLNQAVPNVQNVMRAKQERRAGNAKQASTEIRPWKLPLVCFATSDSRQNQEVPNAEHATKESSTQQKVKNALTVQWTRTRR